MSAVWNSSRYKYVRMIYYIHAIDIYFNHLLFPLDCLFYVYKPIYEILHNDDNEMV